VIGSFKALKQTFWNTKQRRIKIDKAWERELRPVIEQLQKGQ